MFRKLRGLVGVGLVALMACTLANSCIVGRRVSLAPDAASAPTVQARALAAIDSIARNHGLSAAPTVSPRKCLIGRTESGTHVRHWSDGALQMNVCAEPVPPHRLEINIMQDGMSWNDRGRELRDDLPRELRVRFGTEAVKVVRD